MLFPRKTKFKRYQKLKYRLRGFDNRYILPKVGRFGLKILNSFRLRSKQIETIKKVIKRKMLKKSKERVLLSVFPDLPVTKKSSGLRMGKGKGRIDYWAVPVTKGRILFEITGNVSLNFYNIMLCLKKGAKKIPSKHCKLVCV